MKFKTLLTNCQKAAIYTMGNKKVTDAWVTNPIVSYVTLVFPTDIKEQLYRQMRVVFEDPDDGSLSYQCTLSDYQQLGSGPACSVKCFLALFEDEQNTRLDLRVQITFRLQIIPCDEHENFLPKTVVTVTDFSGGGMFFESEETFLPGQLFHFIFKKGPEPHLVSGRILRARHSTKETPQGYACQFVNIEPQTELALRKYVYTQDLLQKNMKLT